MNELLRPLRIRLTVAGFVAIYTPVIVLMLVLGATQEDVTITETSTQVVQTVNWAIVLATAAVLAPVAALTAWVWAGRAIAPVARATGVQQRLIEETSHEIRTPLAVLTTNAEVLLAHPDPTIELFRNGLERSLRTARQLSHTVDGLLVDARDGLEPSS